MATKKYLSIDGLTEYDALIKQEIADSVSGKADASHNHNSLYYTESEIDTKVASINTSITNHTGNASIHVTSDNKTQWNSAYTHSTSAHAPSSAEKNIIVGIQKNGTDLTVNSSTRKVNITVPTTAAEIGAASSTHNHDDKYDVKGAASSALSSANTYTDEKISALLDGATDTTLDSIKELADAIKTNDSAIDALNDIAAGKADATHTHAIADVSGLQSALDGKAAASHGTHVSFDSTNTPKMDGTAAFGTSSKVARADHVHPTDTSRAAKTDLDTHTSNTTVHITSTERTNWGTAYTHSQAAHAPSNAEKNQNAFSNITVGSTTVSADTTTDTVTFVGSNVTITPDATNDKITFAVASGSTSAAGILKLTNSTSSTSTTTAATPSSVKSAYDLANTANTAAAAAQATADGKANASHSHTVANITDLTATAAELNYMDGVTSNVQTQLDGKAATGHSHSAATTSAAGFMTAADKSKLDGIATGANKTTVDSSLSSSSTNPVQNKVVNSAISTLTSTVSANTSSISQHTTTISNIQTALSEIQEITSSEIQALFA